jgi:hypothetical protein
MAVRKFTTVKLQLVGNKHAHLYVSKNKQFTRCGLQQTVTSASKTAAKAQITMIVSLWN